MNAFDNFVEKFKKLIWDPLKIKSSKSSSANKLVYVGHSYHLKTKSTVFLIEYLKKHFDVEVVLDESWIGKPFPDLSFVDNHYAGVVFFQNLPPHELVSRIKNKNIIFFPMYDGSRLHDKDWWGKYENLKIINFSKTLHQKLIAWNFQSMYIQYFPKPETLSPGRQNEVFFWQRLTEINIHNISELFNKNDGISIHMHRAIDPYQEFVEPTEEQMKAFSISFSQWFDTREELWDVVREKAIFIAPRDYEGIGLSFLEAMAMGKAVVALNNPTMNEYIVDGETGYLFDLNNIKKIDLSNVMAIQKNAHEYIQNGYVMWEKDKARIIDFIKSGI
jgi:glycosyltransferase involved in cell wall biosynthesis